MFGNLPWSQMTIKIVTKWFPDFLFTTEPTLFVFEATIKKMKYWNWKKCFYYNAMVWTWDFAWVNMLHKPQNRL